MGISANLELAIHKEEYDENNDLHNSIVDYCEESSLYDFLPEKLHPFIFKSTIEVYDFEEIAKEHNLKYGTTLKEEDIVCLNLEFCILKDGTKVSVYKATEEQYEQAETRLIRVNMKDLVEEKVKLVECNMFCSTTLTYLGSKGVFVDNIYQLYNENNQSYPYVFQIEDFDKIYSYKKGNYKNFEDFKSKIMTMHPDIDLNFSFVNLHF